MIACLTSSGAIASLMEFDPATSERIFRLGMDDYTEAIFLPGLLQHIEQVAPKSKIQVFLTNWQKDRRWFKPGTTDFLGQNSYQAVSWADKLWSVHQD